MLKNSLFIAKKDFQYALKEKTLLLWLFIMPVVFFGFIGSTTGGLSGSSSNTVTNIAVWEHNPGAVQSSELAQQIIFRLQQENFNVVIFNESIDKQEQKYHFENYTRRLWLPENMQQKFENNEPIKIEYASSANGLSQNHDQFAIEKALYQTLGDVLLVKKMHQANAMADFKTVNNLPRNIQVEISSAGEKQQIPADYNQAVPGILVMFIMMIALSSGSLSLFLERQTGVLKRLAATPLTRREIILGKWLGKWFITILQLVYGMFIGWLLFKIHWGNHIVAIFMILLIWAAFNSALAVLLGSYAKSEGQVSAISTVASLLLAAMGGCWWPIEITPQWMQNIAAFLPTGWMMDILHQLMYFGGQVQDVGVQVLLLVVIAFIAMRTAFNKFRYS